MKSHQQWLSRGFSLEIYLMNIRASWKVCPVVQYEIQFTPHRQWHLYPDSLTNRPHVDPYPPHQSHLRWETNNRNRGRKSKGLCNEQDGMYDNKEKHHHGPHPRHGVGSAGVVRLWRSRGPVGTLSIVIYRGNVSEHIKLGRLFQFDIWNLHQFF